MNIISRLFPPPAFSSSFLFWGLQALPFLVLSTRSFWSVVSLIWWALHWESFWSSIANLDIFCLQIWISNITFRFFCFLTFPVFLLNLGCWGSSPFTFVEGRNSSPPGSLQADANKKVKMKCLDLQLDFLKDDQRRLFYLRSACCLYE